MISNLPVNCDRREVMTTKIFAQHVDALSRRTKHERLRRAYVAVDVDERVTLETIVADSNVELQQSRESQLFFYIHTPDRLILILIFI